MVHLVAALMIAFSPQQFCADWAESFHATAPEYRMCLDMMEMSQRPAVQMPAPSVPMAPLPDVLAPEPLLVPHQPVCWRTQTGGWCA